jgi:hypothetical protein
MKENKNKNNKNKNKNKKIRKIIQMTGSFGIKS